MRGPKWPFAALALVAMAGGVVLALRHQRTEVLRNQIELARNDQRELMRLRAEKQRLAAQQISEAELQSLRSDRAAVLRLRAEVDALRARTEQMERAASAPNPPVPTSRPKPAEKPKIAFTMGVRPDGRLALDDGPLDLNALRQRIVAAGPGKELEISLRQPIGQKIDMAEMKRSMTVLNSLAKELGIPMTVHLAPPVD